MTCSEFRDTETVFLRATQPGLIGFSLTGPRHDGRKCTFIGRSPKDSPKDPQARGGTTLKIFLIRIRIGQ